MTTILLNTTINASIETCFKISLDVGIHERSMDHTGERAIAGRKSGICELNDEITWEAKHFGIRQKLCVRITKVRSPFFFEDTMMTGAFKSMRHEHYFEFIDGKTHMRDVFNYEVPYGITGKIFDRLVLKSYMRKLLISRNNFIKKTAEQDES